MSGKIRQNFAQYLRSLQILYFCLLAGSIICLVVFYLLPSKSDLPDNGLTVRIPIVVVLLLATGFFLGRNRVEAARNQETLRDKMNAYRAAVILRWALLEGSTLLAAVFFFLSRNLLLLGVAGIGLVLLSMFVPTRDRIVTELDLSSGEQTKLDDPNEIVAVIEQRG